MEALRKQRCAHTLRALEHTNDATVLLLTCGARLSVASLLVAMKLQLTQAFERVPRLSPLPRGRFEARGTLATLNGAVPITFSGFAKANITIWFPSPLVVISPL